MMLERTFKDKQRIVKGYRLNLTNEATNSELKLKEILEKDNIKFIFQKGFIQGEGFFIADFYLPKQKLVIEVDGEIHNTWWQKKRDKKKNKYLTEERGFGILRITNREVWKLKSASELIATCIRGKVIYSPNYFIPKANA